MVYMKTTCIKTATETPQEPGRILIMSSPRRRGGKKRQGLGRSVDTDFDFCVKAMGTSLRKYEGLWVAIADGKVVAEGKNQRVVFERARPGNPEPGPPMVRVL